MAITKTSIEHKIARKRNLQLKQLIIRLKKQNRVNIASMLALPKRKRIEVNIGKLDRETKEGDTVIVPGKVLGSGNISHNITIAAFSFSQEAKSKLKEGMIKDIEDIIKNKDVKIIK